MGGEDRGNDAAAAPLLAAQRPAVGRPVSSAVDDDGCDDLLDAFRYVYGAEADKRAKTVDIASDSEDDIDEAYRTIYPHLCCGRGTRGKHARSRPSWRAVGITAIAVFGALGVVGVAVDRRRKASRRESRDGGDDGAPARDSNKVKDLFGTNYTMNDTFTMISRLKNVNHAANYSSWSMKMLECPYYDDDKPYGFDMCGGHDRDQCEMRYKRTYFLQVCPHACEGMAYEKGPLHATWAIVCAIEQFARLPTVCEALGNNISEAWIDTKPNRTSKTLVGKYNNSYATSLQDDVTQLMDPCETHAWCYGCDADNAFCNFGAQLMAAAVIGSATELFDREAIDFYCAPKVMHSIIEGTFWRELSIGTWFSTRSSDDNADVDRHDDDV